jgi:hypothetical protein
MILLQLTLKHNHTLINTLCNVYELLSNPKINKKKHVQNKNSISPISCREKNTVVQNSDSNGSNIKILMEIWCVEFMYYFDIKLVLCGVDLQIF